MSEIEFKVAASILAIGVFIIVSSCPSFIVWARFGRPKHMWFGFTLLFVGLAVVLGCLVYGLSKLNGT